MKPSLHFLGSFLKIGVYMAEKFKIIDEKNWKRATHYQVFKNYLEPFYCVTVELDITHFLSVLKEKNISFTPAMIFMVTKCANKIEEFRYRIENSQVVLYDQIHTGFTYLDKDTELFKVVNVPMEDSLEAYVFEATRLAKEQREYFTGPLGNDIFMFSPMPWVTFTHKSHTISGKKDNATPLIDWGKYYEKDDKIILPFSVQVHHAFVDGLHVGKLVTNLQKDLNNFQ